jgi:hypothetical protein
MKTKCYVFILFIALVPASVILAQSTDASITGRVQNAVKMPLAGSSVTVINESTGFKSVTQTNNEGEYYFRQLPLGSPYKVEVTSVGFTSQVNRNLTLNLGDQLVINFLLEVRTGSLEDVVVRTNPLTKRIDRYGASTAISAKTIQQIPAQNRNFSSLASLAPTTNGGNIGGQRFSSTNYVIDGVSARNNLTSGALGQRALFIINGGNP